MECIVEALYLKGLIEQAKQSKVPTIVINTNAKEWHQYAREIAEFIVQTGL
ncbi:hypothetical protein ABE142_24640 [Paenibacillus alvei]|uniref:hypothetical protein n=1 Tax=Paenibacillus alvei TaxID=44250 RepID=UPI003D2E3291